MKIAFYPRLAWDGIRKNKRMYIPFLITSQLCVCMFYLMRSLQENPVIRRMKGGSTTAEVLMLGSIVIGVFSVIFLFYTHSFLIRRRKKEFGLYNVLGMDKHSIGRILLWENLMSAGISLAAGLFMGILVSKLGELVLLRMMGNTVQNGFYVSGRTLLMTLALFAAIFGLLLLNSIRQVRFSTATELLRSDHAGEKPPKANWVLAVLGLILLGLSYYMAVGIQEVLTALLLFFVAVILVIVATYLLMISGSVTLCRALQRNKRYYYKPSHFISVSSMSYRMKRNGAGLASICILATMVLVMISTTSCLYFGSENVIMGRYPRGINFVFKCTDGEGMNKLSADCRELIREEAARFGFTPENTLEYGNATIVGCLMDDALEVDSSKADANPLLYEKVVIAVFMDQAEYNRYADTPLSLKDDEVMLFSDRIRYSHPRLTIADTEYRIAGNLDKLEHRTASVDVSAYPNLYIITPNMAKSIKPLLSLKDNTDYPLLQVEWHYHFDAPVDLGTQNAFLTGTLDRINQNADRSSIRSVTASNREVARADYYGTFAGFFFLCILLSLVFLVATTVMIYYKQLTEGYEDQGRFAILRKVGMSREAIRKSIHHQMLTVFFFPLALAVLHLCFAFNMIRKILILFGLTDLKLLLITAAISVVVFALFYVLVYLKTTSVYYRLVSGVGEKE